MNERLLYELAGRYFLRPEAIPAARKLLADAIDEDIADDPDGADVTEPDAYLRHYFQWLRHEHRYLFQPDAPAAVTERLAPVGDADAGKRSWDPYRDAPQFGDKPSQRLSAAYYYSDLDS